MPDFDVDFDERRRGEVIRYVTEKYGEDRVAQIVTYGTIKAKQAVKDAARVLGYPFSLGERITKAMPPAVMGKDIPLSRDLRPSPPAATRRPRSSARCTPPIPRSPQVVETARGLESLKRQWGVHAAGVIMSSEPLIDHVPIMRREQDGAIITQFDYPTLRVARPDQDGLPRPAEPDDHRRRAAPTSIATAARRVAWRRSTLDDPGDLRAARPRRHPRRLPVRRRPDALAAAAHAPRQLRGHLRRRRALPARPDGRELAHQLRAAQERPAGDHAAAPRAGRAARGRSWARPTA